MQVEQIIRRLQVDIHHDPAENREACKHLSKKIYSFLNPGHKNESLQSALREAVESWDTEEINELE
jgi:hypothetical protein